MVVRCSCANIDQGRYQILSGIELQDALDPLGDQTYYFTAARCASDFDEDIVARILKKSNADFTAEVTLKGTLLGTIEFQMDFAVRRMAHGTTHLMV